MPKMYMNDQWESLAMAIILSAVDDYRRALKSVKINPEAQAEIESIERFFRSRWFSVLTPVSGELLIDRLRKG